MRVVAVILGVGLMTVSQCWAHGHAASPRNMPDTLEHPSADPTAPKPFHDWLQPDAHDSKNPYESMSCSQLYVLATQSAQNSDLADAFKEKDCHAL